MRLNIVKSGATTRIYVIKSTYDRKTRKTSSKTVEALGSVEEICEREGIDDALTWAKAHLEEMNSTEKERSRAVLISCHPARQIDKDRRHLVSGGYLFLQKICSELRLKDLCAKIQAEGDFNYDLAEIFSHLVFGRVLFPASKRSTIRFSEGLMEPAGFKLHQVYRALSVLAGHNEEIQAGLYGNSLRLHARNDRVLYYDCTNFYFEIEDADGDRQYGISKEHRPNPIVQMGLFMDGDGIPLAFTMTPGNVNEQTTMKPLEKTILSDFHLSRFVVCTDAGLSSKANREFNTEGKRSFITTQSIRKLKGHLRKWALSRTGWRLVGDAATYDLDEIEEKGFTDFYDRVFYKERMIKDDDGFEQRMIVTFSFKYREYLASVRERQIERARAKIEKGPATVAAKRQTDPLHLVRTEHVTEEGEVAKTAVSELDGEKIAEEASTDGFYAVATNLTGKDDVAEILKVNSGRWQIEECFRIMKTEFEARPVYLSRTERIEAHFLTCFTALLVYRLLERKLDYRFTCAQIIDTLKGMDFLEVAGEGYIPVYTRTDITDALHEACGFRTDYEIVTNRKMRGIIAASRRGKD